MTGTSIGEALLREIDEREHAAYFADVRAAIARRLGYTANPDLVMRLRVELTTIYGTHCNKAGKRLRRIRYHRINPETNRVEVTIEPFVPPPYLTRQP